MGGIENLNFTVDILFVVKSSIRTSVVKVQTIHEVKTLKSSMPMLCFHKWNKIQLFLSWVVEMGKDWFESSLNVS